MMDHICTSIVSGRKINGDDVLFQGLHALLRLLGLFRCMMFGEEPGRKLIQKCSGRSTSHWQGTDILPAMKFEESEAENFQETVKINSMQ